MLAIRQATLWGTTDQEWQTEWRHDTVARAWAMPTARSVASQTFMAMRSGDVLLVPRPLTTPPLAHFADRLEGERVSYRLRTPPAPHMDWELVFDKLVIGERMVIG